MAADFSRIRLNQLLDYAGVELKQGGVLLDADANELVAILDRRLRALASDTLGRATVSSTTPEAFKITAVGNVLQIGKGRLYVDGLLAENHGATPADLARDTSDPLKAEPEFDPLLAEPTFVNKISYTHQPYLASPPALPTSGRHLVYLDVWNRELTHLEQPALVESAVAVETSSRQQTVWQVRVLAADAGSATCHGTSDDQMPGWSDVIAASTGVLTTGTFDVAPTVDPCELPPSGGYRGLENQLYRVEIQDSGQPGGTATFKWSRENASVGSRVSSMVSDSELELETLGRDDVLRINTGDWVEIIDDTCEFAHTCGEIRKVTVNDATRRISFSPKLPATMLPASYPDNTFPARHNLRVRRWDQKGKVFRTDSSGTPAQVQDLDAASSTGVIKVPAAGTTLLLENGVTVSFASTGTKGFKAGDWWVFAARTADASVEKLDRAPPRGIHHHYARLGIWDVAAGTVSDCRNPWPPKGDGGDCSCTECVTPESHASGQLTIQDAVDRVHDTGGTVCLHTGRYVLDTPVHIAAAKSLRITGQGPATVIVSPGTAFAIERSAAIGIDSLSIVSLGQASAISVRTAFGLTLRQLVIAVFGDAKAQGAAIALGGLLIGTSITDNLLLAPDGIRAPATGNDKEARGLVTAAMHIDHNIFWCLDSAIQLDGLVGHALDTRMTGNQVLATHDVGLSATGLTLPGASMRISDNTLQVHGPGIRCAVDGTWISDNKLLATRDGDRLLKGAGIALVKGLDATGIDQAQVLANQVEGFADAGIAVNTRVQDLLVKLNIISRCSNGIVVRGASRAGAISIENNHLRDIGLSAKANAANLSSETFGIAIQRAEAATVAGNTLRQVGRQAIENQKLIAGIVLYGVRQARVSHNEIHEIGPLDEFGGTVAGIGILPPYALAEVNHNHVERDAQFITTPSDTDWYALLIDAPASSTGMLSRRSRYATMQVQEQRMLMMLDTHAFMNIGMAVDQTVVNASVLGNVLIARGRAPAVAITADEVLFNDNRCELRAGGKSPAVLLDVSVALINANRVRSAELSIQVPNQKAAVAAIGNITTGPIDAQLKAEMQPLNLIA